MRVGSVKFLQKAALHFTQALGEDEQFVPARLNLANTLVQLTNLEAQKDCASPMHPDFVQKRRAVLETSAGHYKTVILTLRKDRAQPVASLGATERDVAIEAEHDEEDDTKDSLVTALHNLGVVEMRLGEFRQAVDHFLAAVELRPAYSDAHCNLATVLRLMGS